LKNLDRKLTPVLAKKLGKVIPHRSLLKEMGTQTQSIKVPNVKVQVNEQVSSHLNNHLTIDTS
jgi:hypothetical protein